MEAKTEIKRLGFLGSFAIYIPAAMLMYCLTAYLIPYLSSVTGQEPVLFWFMVGGLGVFTPLIITGLLILKSEGCKMNKHTWVWRLRFRKLTLNDLLWTLIGLVSVGILTLAVMQGLTMLIGNFSHSPAFMTFEPLTAGRYWLLLLWLPYWVLNILGEEFLWRGVMLPRQEVAFANRAWLVHGVGWALFHIAFGWQLLVMLLPLIFIQSYIVQKTKNSWVGVIMHAVINGPSFIAICFGLIQ